MGPCRSVEMRLVLARPDDGIRSTKRAVGRFRNDVYSVRIFNGELGSVRRLNEGNFTLVDIPE